MFTSLSVRRRAEANCATCRSSCRTDSWPPRYGPDSEDLLLEIQNYCMDIFEESVLLPVLSIADLVERLKACVEKNIDLGTEGASKRR